MCFEVTRKGFPPVIPTQAQLLIQCDVRSLGTIGGWAGMQKPSFCSGSTQLRPTQKRPLMADMWLDDILRTSCLFVCVIQY